MLCALAIAAPAAAQIADLRLPISLDADSTDYDGRTSMLMFEGLRLSQGNIGVQADKGLASQLDFENAVWQFQGNVVIDTGEGRIQCDDADLRFEGHELSFATITGTPATFEFTRANTAEKTYAEAGRLDYDFAKGIIEFSGDAVITEGGNQISSNLLVYNIREQRINAQSAGDGKPRVKITYTPRPGAENEATGGDEPAGGNSEASTDPADDGEAPDDGPGAGPR